jgi:hypothetical protein
MVGGTADSSKAGAMVVVAGAVAGQTEAHHRVVTASSNNRASIQGRRATGLQRDSSTAGQIGAALLQAALLVGRPQQVLLGASTPTPTSSSSSQRKASTAAVM